MRLFATTVLAVVTLASCAREPARSVAPAQPPERRVAAAPPRPPAQYLVADPIGRAVIVLPLGPSGALGLVVDRARVVFGRGEPHVASVVAGEPIVGGARVPGRLGAGYLFWGETTLYRARTFEGALEPIARVPESIQTISFGPRFALVRTRNGERWALSLPDGSRAAVEPLGVADIEALDDGRALAFDDQGAAFSSVDGGKTWTDVTAQVRSSPSRVAVVDGELWLLESSGVAHRLEPDGRLSLFDKAPAEKPLELRPRDPRWRGSDPPLRAVFRGGAAVDDRVAVVVEAGDLVQIDVRTAEIVSIVPGRLPPDARCDGIATASDVLFACVAPGNGGAFVVSRTLVGDAPVIEQTFAADGAFSASDDGGLLFEGPCSAGAPSTSGQVACVRQPGGSWRELDVSGLGADAAAGDVTVARWVPRADGRAVALVTEPTVGVYDPSLGALTPLPDDARDVLSQGQPLRSARSRKGYARRDGVVDRSWSLSPSGALRGWQRRGGVVEIDGGKVTRSPYDFEIASAGAYAIGRTRDGRLFQSTDHGASWAEVAAPPAHGATEMRSCSSAGCDLGGFYRVGWAPRPPEPRPPVEEARPAPEVRRTPGVELTCRPAGPASARVLPRTSSSPDDLGLGLKRLPVAGEREDVAYLRTPLARALVHPIYGPDGADTDGAALRAMLSGYETAARSSDVIEVLGPTKNPLSLRRALSYVMGFDPEGRVRNATVAMSEVVAAGRAAGLSTEEILSEDMTESGVVVLVTPHDPGAASEIALHHPRGLLALTRGAERVRLGVRPPQNEAVVISGIALGRDEAAFLELESGGVGHVFKMTAGGLVDLFDLSPTINEPTFYPANPDALAVGPRGDVAVVRTPSGSDPPSPLDPALLLVPAMPPVALAPWSTLTPESDPACRADTGGYRTTLQIVAPWVRVTTPELRAESAPMFARVRWSRDRVCLEGLELKAPDVTVRGAGGGSEPVEVGTWIVARGGAFARVGVGEGVEWRQPLACTWAAPRRP